MYYAILGKDACGNSNSSIDIYNHNSEQWELTSGLNYNLGQTSAIEFRNMIYATGYNSGAIV